MEKENLYKNPIMHTSQFPMCGNSFRVDTYRNCDFGCKYCFANNRNGNFETKTQIADINLISKWMHEAIIKGESNNIKKEMLKQFVPLHLGGMSDPFQCREWKYGVTKEFLKLSKKYNYPVNISTKTDNLPDEYFEILDPKIHTFQISLIGISDEYIRRFETNTPLANSRINFIKKLKDMGFWVSIRIQPIIKINEVVELIKQTEKLVNYYTIEHLKLPSDNNAMMKIIIPLLHDNPVKLISKGREYEFGGAEKLKNIKLIKSITNVKIGCGDNDFHTMSDSLNCCGIDTMPEAFNNWMKYNSMYIKMTGDRDVWFPKNNCNGCFNSTCIVKGFKTMNQYTDKYYNNLYGNDLQTELF
jgi:DNA repair photolyase